MGRRPYFLTHRSAETLVGPSGRIATHFFCLGAGNACRHRR